MAKRPYIKLYVDDFLGSFKTQSMSTEQIGAYFLMLLAASQEDNIDLPNDPNYLAMITRLGKRYKNSESILKMCFKEENGRLYNDKLRKVLYEYDQFAKNQRDKSAKAVEAKRNKIEPMDNPRVSSGEATDNPNPTQPEPITNNHNQEPTKEVANATKKGISLHEFRLIVDQALAPCIFSDKFTEKSKSYFYSWAKTENKITALKKIKTDLAKYFQKEIDYLSKYAPNQIEYMLEQASRKCYIGYVEKDLPEPQRIIKPQLQELYSDPEPAKPKEPIQFNIPDEFK